jgi:hypothetical protein
MRKLVLTMKVVLALLLFASGLLVVQHTFARKQGAQNPKPVRPRMDLPVTTLQSSDTATIDELETRRRMRYNSSQKATIDEQKIATCSLPIISANMGDLPLNRTDTIVMGSVTTARAVLSADRTNIFSQFTVQIENTIKGSVPSRTITLERHGGAVVLDSGARIERGGCYNRMPAIGHAYIFFLQSQPDTDDFKIITAFEIKNDTVYALDGTDSSTDETMKEFKRFDGKTTEAFLNQIAKGATR